MNNWIFNHLDSCILLFYYLFQILNMKIHNESSYDYNIRLKIIIMLDANAWNVPIIEIIINNYKILKK